MGNAALFRLWGFRALFVAVVTGIVLVQLLPMHPEAARLPGPDIILALTIAWAMRQSRHLPILLLAGVMLVVDFLLMRPPGLMAALSVLAVEFIRSREDQWRNLPMPVEWLIGAALIAGVLLLNALVLAILIVPEATLGQMLIRLIMTVLIYPLAMLAVRLVFMVPPRVGDGEIGGRA